MGEYELPRDSYEALWKEREVKEWIDHVKNEVAPMIEESRFSIAIWDGTVDVKNAVELGYMILLDKPIIVARVRGQEVPPKLVRIADAVVDLDPEGGEENATGLATAIREVLERSGSPPWEAAESWLSDVQTVREGGEDRSDG